MLKLLIATHNPGKLREIKSLLDMAGLELISPGQIGLKLQVAETGNSYAENAAIKANAYAASSGMLTLADDSGLEVEALGGEPGLHSARFVGKIGATDADRRRLLLQQLSGLPRPWNASFRCVVALVQPDEEVRFSQGVCSGEIIPEERGHNGFGYDPIFLIPEFGKTMAELSIQEKNNLSHRARAVRSSQLIIAEYLAKLKN
jgi:XTP/dITP diphosphohydrolase